MTSKLQVLTDTALKFNGEAGADVAFSVEGILNGTGRVSAQYDQGASPRVATYNWDCSVFFQATPTQGATLDFYLAVAPDNDSTMISGDVGAIDAALGLVDQLRNLEYIGSVEVESAGTTEMISSGVFTVTNRYFSIVAYNRSGTSINATDSNFVFNVVPYQIQAQDT